MGVLHLNAGQFQRRWHNIEKLYRAFDHVASGHAGGSYDKRHPRQGIVQAAGPFFHQAIIASPIAVVRKSDDRRIL